MKRLTFLLVFLFSGLIFTMSLAGNSNIRPKLLLLITEQNIQGPQKAWWASEVDLSAVEAVIAQKLIESGFEVIEPSKLAKVIKKDRAFRMMDLSEPKSVKLGNLSKADFVILGKAIASSGGKVPQSNMVSCFANVTAKLIRIKDGKVVAYLDARGSFAHLDVISGGREALENAAKDLAVRIINAVN